MMSHVCVTDSGQPEPGLHREPAPAFVNQADGRHVRASGPATGTGNGLGGGIVAMLVGLIGMALGVLALAHSRRVA